MSTLKTLSRGDAPAFDRAQFAVAAVVLPVAGTSFLLRGGLKPLLQKWYVRRKVQQNRRANPIGQQYQPGTFEYNYYTHGCGRQQLPRWLRCDRQLRGWLQRSRRVFASS